MRNLSAHTIQVLVPMMRALLHMHERGFIHRDIKPENTLFAAGKVLKLAGVRGNLCCLLCVLSVRAACVPLPCMFRSGLFWNGVVDYHFTEPMRSFCSPNRFWPGCRCDDGAPCHAPGDSG